MEEKPNFEYLRSPLLEKAKCFAEMLRKDNEAIEDYLAKGGNPKKISIEIDDEEESCGDVIEMQIIPGVCESNLPETVAPDSTEMPEGTWNKAGVENRE